MMTQIETCASVLAFVGFACLVHYHFAAARALGRAKRETSRFPLFAARDRLVMLVADGTMDEEDPSWARLYKSVNFLLQLEQQLHALDVAMKYINYQIALAKNPELQERLRQFERESQETQRKIPEFRAAQDALNRALAHMIGARTTAWHKVVLYSLVVVIRVIGIALNAGTETAKTVFRAVRRGPSADDLNGWRRVTEDHVTA